MEDKLIVKMFGKFSLIYNGQSLLGNKASGTQFVYLMQLLLHHRKDGVRREELQEALFGDREIEDRLHALQSVIYNAKKKLERGGLPKKNYIISRNNAYFWNEEIPVDEDAETVDQLYEKLQHTTNREERRVLETAITNLYRGEFLGEYSEQLWVAFENRKYSAIYCKCVEELAEILYQKEEYTEMERLGRRASAIDPFCDWESITMEALIASGRFEEASELYAKTVDLYFRERGLKPSPKFIALLDRLADKIQHPVEVLDNIQNRLLEGQEHRKGGYLCTYPVFQGIYHIMTRLMERNGQSVYLMLCTIVDSKGNPMKDGDKLAGLSDRLEEAICKSIRQSDAVNRYGKGQYLVLLFNTTRENCKIIQKRINYNFIIGRQRTGLEFYVNSVFKDELPS